MRRDNTPQHTDPDDPTIKRPGGLLGEKPAPHTETPPNKPGQYDHDEQRAERSELAGVGQADEQIGTDEPSSRASRPSHPK